jgi:kynurenine formamidase
MTTRARKPAASTSRNSNGRAVTPKVPSEATVLGYVKQLSNWGRWGKDDQIGTLNLITPKKRTQAAGLVKDGVSVSCARPITREMAADVRAPFQHYMTGTGVEFADKPMTPGRLQGSGDFYGIAYHGHYYTHLDASAHIFWEGKMYNGRSAAVVTAREGATAGAIGLVHQGVVTKGVLLDIPRLKRKQWLEPGDFIFPEDLDAAEEAQGVKAEQGDALLIRTGHWKRRTEQGAWNTAEKSAGLHAACLPWIHQRGVAMLGSDTANDATPSGYPAFPLPIHQVGIPHMGLWLMDNGNFEELAAACADRKRWAFMFVLAPLRIVNGTGSPANPLAIL